MTFRKVRGRFCRQSGTYAGLERDGCEVRFRKFDGAHEVPAEVACEAMEWFVG